VRQVPPRAWPGGTATRVTSPGNTAEPPGELSVGDMVVVGETALTVCPAGFAPLRGTFTPVRVREHGTHPIE
jgi:hypothetical protein